MTRQPVHVCGEEIERPGHICAFFSSREEEYNTLIPYFKEGVACDEDVLNVLDASRLTDHHDRLTSGGVSVDGGRVSVASSEETYLADGRFEMERMVEFLLDRLAAAAAEGRHVRTAGWMDWMAREAPGTERVMEYEARMNQIAPDFDCTFMCIYDLSKLSGETVVDIMATHPYVILKGQIRKNPFFIPPEVYLKELIAE